MVNLKELNGRKGRDDDGNGYIDDIYGIDAANNDVNPADDHGHGTHVAGTIGAAGNNGTGVAGVNWNVRIMPCKFISSGGTGLVSDAVECLEYVRVMKSAGANIVATNNSWGGTEYSQALSDAVKAQQDILFIAAAGNSGIDTDGAAHYPSGFSLPNIISVAATDRYDARAYFSNYGRRTVHAGAPGVDIVSLRAAGTDMYGDGRHFVPAGDGSAKYYRASGTSMAAPHVAGLAALVKARHLTKDWVFVRNRILAGGDVLPSLSGLTVTNSRVNAYGSLTCSDRPVFSALHPPRERTPGTPVILSALSINCESPAGPATVVISGGETIGLRDDGQAPDLAANDGIFSALWTPAGSSAYFTFSSPAGTDAYAVPSLKVATSLLPEANIRYTYSGMLAASGGLPPYTWSISSGSLPGGLSLDSATGEISGLPSETGQFFFTVAVRDSLGSEAVRSLSLRVADDDVEVLWMRSYEGGTSTYARDMARDSSGNLVVSGAVWNGSVSSELVFTYDPSGALVRARTFPGGDGSAVAVDNLSGTIHVAGALLNQNYDFYAAKLDSLGNLAWSRTYDAGASDFPRDITVDGSGNVYVTGESHNGQNYDYLTVKYDPSGSLLWARRYDGGRSEYAAAAAVDASGSLFVTGYEWDGSRYNCVTLKYNTEGAVLSAWTYAGGSCDDIAVDGTGSVYLAGHAGVSWYLGQIDALTLKYDAQGGLLWARTFDAGKQESAAAIAVDGSGSAYVTGTSSDGYLTVVNALTLAYDASGSLLWTKKFDTGGNDFATGIAADGAGDVYISGHSSALSVLNPKTFTIKYRPHD